MYKKYLLFCLLGVTALTAGCAYTRSEVKLGGYDTAGANYTVTKPKVVLIRSVTDERIFEESPSQPNVPSLGHEGSSQATADTKARAISRKRNGFGRALGDVLLKDGQTVPGIVRDNLVAALRQAGYRTTTNAAEAGASPIIIDAHIKQFWAWSEPGFMTVKLSANIATGLEIVGAASQTNVSVHSEDSSGAASDGARVAVIDKALREYRAQVREKFAHLQ